MNLPASPTMTATIPQAGMIADSQGNLYGVTQAGGTGNCTVLGLDVGCGLVYQMSPPAVRGGAWTETIIYNFQGGLDGYVPSGNLIFDGKGNLYGATQFGGGGGSCNPYFQYCGTIFELSPPKQKGGAWTEKVLYSFKNGKDGGQPNGGLTFDKHGALYGTTFCGGSIPCNGNRGVGVAFKIAPPAKHGGRWGYELVYSFSINGLHGAGPDPGLVFDGKGNIYGAAVDSGQSDGIVFKLVPPAKQGRQWKETILHSFSIVDGVGPNSGLIFDKAGNLYGTTYGGGNPPEGVIFRLLSIRNGKSWKFSVIYNFKGPPDGFSPLALIFDALGDLYGTTLGGGNGTACRGGCGTVFEVSP
jgi:hypothetical protein